VIIIIIRKLPDRLSYTLYADSIERMPTSAMLDRKLLHFSFWGPVRSKMSSARHLFAEITGNSVLNRCRH